MARCREVDWDRPRPRLLLPSREEELGEAAPLPLPPSSLWLGATRMAA